MYETLPVQIGCVVGLKTIGLYSSVDLNKKLYFAVEMATEMKEESGDGVPVGVLFVVEGKYRYA